jgi:hypothetical protein
MTTKTPMARTLINRKTRARTTIPAAAANQVSWRSWA